MSADDASRWDARYAEPGLPSPPERFFQAHAHRLPSSGRALDVAGGTGRNGLWLAGCGLSTSIVDVSRVGLDVAQRRAEERGLSVQTICLDLEESTPRGPWDVILVAWFLVRGPWEGLVSSLSIGGSLWVVHPTTRNTERHARPSARWLLEPGELDARARASGLEPLVSEEGWDEDGRHTARGIWRRR